MKLKPCTPTELVMVLQIETAYLLGISPRAVRQLKEN